MNWENRCNQALAVVKRSVSPARYLHIEGVVQTAMILATRYSLDPMAIRMAAILHDRTKELPKPQQLKLLEEVKPDLMTLKSPALWHAKTAHYLAIHEFQLSEEWAEPIRWHTTGRENMSLSDMVLYVADQIEPGREFYDPKDMELAQNNIYAAMKKILQAKLMFTMQKGQPLHQDSLACWNWLCTSSPRVYEA
jgi:predicted HD superfamily hydrolase involved in NAD metabolism